MTYGQSTVDLWTSVQVEDWRDQALCAQVDPEIFFPDAGKSPAPARKMCARCEVRAECLQSALERDEEFGIWGGLTWGQRRALQRGAQPRECGVCNVLFIPGQPDQKFCSTSCGGTARHRRLAS
ncbi:hypothetical protein PBI_QUEENHAZEL_40 [Mycobacterium phage QueenHazel]|uniref:WhiB family transcription factor n=1 Tax=Mycobacterium phage Xula TaxID=2599884 RepID=A0A5J6TKL2_9CAUD|nr:WhiB family transcription factor [Mycobacterium phage Xula]QFG11146.1 WhiB family transcription factor [Mycobacterium phage Xula]QFG15080.1 hypothetical protein PBI_QUEENHAZEL_40 [Mycobacterium phage QueenHazel]